MKLYNEVRFRTLFTDAYAIYPATTYSYDISCQYEIICCCFVMRWKIVLKLQASKSVSCIVFYSPI